MQILLLSCTARSDESSLIRGPLKASHERNHRGGLVHTLPDEVTKICYNIIFIIIMIIMKMITIMITIMIMLMTIISIILILTMIIITTIYMLFHGREVLMRKTVPEILNVCGEGRAFKTEGKVFLDTDRPRPGNNIFTFLLLFTNENRTFCRDV